MRGDLFRINQDNEVIQNHLKKNKPTFLPLIMMQMNNLNILKRYRNKSQTTENKIVTND